MDVFIKLSLVLFLLTQFAFSEVFLAGRGVNIDSYLWKVKKDKIISSDILAQRGENFAIVRDKDSGIVYSGGALNNGGIVWEYSIKNKQVKYSTLPESRVIYALAIDFQNKIVYAAGVHEHLGGYIWKKKSGGKWEKVGNPDNSSMITCLVVDDKARVFAGGLAYSNGVVWVLDKENLTRGNILNNSNGINVLLKTKDKIYAAGNKRDNKGGIWGFDGNSWKEGPELKFSQAIYTGAVNKDNVIYLAGAGDENKVIWENSKGFWNAITLKDCIALYAFYFNKKNDIYAGGWNNKRKGRVWYQPRKSVEWKEGYDIPEAFVIRGIN